MTDISNYPTAQDLADKLGVPVERVIKSIRAPSAFDVIGGKVGVVWRVEPCEIEGERFKMHKRLLRDPQV